MKRFLVLAALGLVLFGAGLMTGRLTISKDTGFQPGSLPGDDALEQAWENFLHSQRAALLRLRDSEFYGDDQERAEAYFAMLQDIGTTTVPGRHEAVGDALAGVLPVSPPPDQPLTPNGMAGILERAADSIYRRTGERLALARQAFESAPNGITRLRQKGGVQVGVGHWDLDNEHALLIELAPGTADDVELSLGNVWAMDLESAAGGGLGPGRFAPGRFAPGRFACKGESGCRLILSHRDPELVGWLDTGGHRRGLLRLRWPGGAQAPEVKVVRFDDLRRQGDTP